MDIQAPEEVFYLALPPVMNTIHTWIEFKQETTRERLLEEGFESIANALAKRERDVCDLADSYALAVQGLLNYTKSKHSKIYKSAIRQFGKEPFECKAEGIFQFLRDVQDRANEVGWSDGILNIKLEETDKNNPVQEKLIQNYGMILLEQVVESELQYINEQGREAQDTYMLYKCLMASLSNAAKKRVSYWLVRPIQDRLS